MLNKEEYQKYFEEKIKEVINLNHKGNNLLFKIILRNEETFLLKVYSKIHMDNWERGKAEFKALKYLWENSFREIPKAIKFDEETNIGIYSFEKGKILQGKEVGKEDVEKIVDFLVKLHSLKNKEQFGAASSACLNLAEYLNVIDRRLSKIVDFKPETKEEEKVRKFLDEKLIPKINKVKKDFLNKVREKGWDLDKELNIDEQVLTPADFGFHNILVDEQGNYKFLDFEYFGRDDPARQILDFFHHAKSVDINEKLKQYFIDLYCEKRGMNTKFKEKLELLSPLIAITWVLIYLNVLSKKQLEHVKFAQGNVENLIEERLKNAEKKLEDIG